MRRAAFATTLLAFAVSGCFQTAEDFQAQADNPWLFTGYDPGGRTATHAEGVLTVALDTDGNAGTIRATARDLVRQYEVRWHSFAGRPSYQSGGVARDLDLWGDTGNGSGAFPKMSVYAAAWGNATFLVNGAVKREPQALTSTYGSVFFLNKGRYRSPADHRVLSADQNATFDPSRPGDGFVDRQGAQATLLLFTARGDVAFHVQYYNVTILRR